MQERLQLTPKPTETFSDDELLHRLRLLILGDFASSEQKAVLGMTAEPKLSLSDAFVRFWDHIKDEWMKLSHDQQRVKRNIYLKSIRNFEAVIGRKKGLYDIERKDALKFRSC